MTIEKLREHYMAQGLDHDSLDIDPVKQFEDWYGNTIDSGLYEPGAMSLATVDENNQPWQRIVLLKLFDEKGFVFFTNYESRKARQMAGNPQVSLLFPWHALARQVKITGSVEKITTAESLSYFVTRPRGSQIGAWASEQSSMISSRSVLESMVDSMKQKFADKEVPLPPFWGGYRVIPDSFEFWQGRDNRLHDRFLYQRDEQGNWLAQRLSP